MPNGRVGGAPWPSLGILPNDASMTDRADIGLPRVVPGEGSGRIGGFGPEIGLPGLIFSGNLWFWAGNREIGACSLGNRWFWAGSGGPNILLMLVDLLSIFQAGAVGGGPGPNFGRKPTQNIN